MWGVIFRVGLGVLEWFLEKKKADRDMMRKFYQFVEKFNDEYMNSAKLKASYAAQLERLKGVKPLPGGSKKKRKH